MKNTLLHINLLLLCMLLAQCTDNDIMTNESLDATDGDFTAQPVLFTVGNERLSQAITRAAVPYMAQDGRFVCTMYYHPTAGATDASDYDIRANRDGGTMATAWLKVNNTVGNSVYRKMTYNEEGMETDNLRFDKNAPIFYWQNRLNHAFLALADYNQLTTNVGDTTATTSQGMLKMYPWGDDEDDKSINVYDLTRGDRDTIAQQPDPIMALTITKPAGATQEANRVRLYFKHQFSQIQVNIKSADDESATITASQILKVELLGVSTEGYVRNRLNANGTVGNVTVGSAAGTMDAAWGKEVNTDDFTDEQLVNNKWGTSFEMFDMASGVLEEGHDKGYAVGFVKSFNAIAFGILSAIRITWEESVGGIKHVMTFEVPATNEAEAESSSDPKPKIKLQDLQSGMKYIYNLELRRGTLAVIRTEILPWEQDEDLLYGTDGTITN